MRLLRFFLILNSAFFLSAPLRADDGYRLWLRYDPIADESLRRENAAAISEIVVSENPRPSIAAARDELVTGLLGLLGREVPVVSKATRDNALIFGNPRDPWIASAVSESDLRTASEEGYVVRRVAYQGGHRIVIVGNREIGQLYGTFALLRHLQTGGKLGRVG